MSTLVPYRSLHTATMLKNGKILIAGGRAVNLEPVAPMELFDPATRTFAPAGSMSPARYGHSATLLASGKVLFIAGNVSAGSPGASFCSAQAQLYDPDTSTFSPLPDLSMYQCEHRAVTLADGRVLVVGFYLDGKLDLFDPATGQFTKTGSMITPRTGGQSATVLNDGRVLVVGGVANPPTYLSSAEVYNPSTASFSAVGNMAAPRGYHTATSLANGKVLIAGGIKGASSTGFTFDPNAEIFDPGTNAFTSGSPLVFVYANATATTLLDNKILIVGGDMFTAPAAGSQLYDPVNGTFSAGGNLAVARYSHTANLLPVGTVLIVGGETGLGPQTVPAEIYDESRPSP